MVEGTYSPPRKRYFDGHMDVEMWNVEKNAGKRIVCFTVLLSERDDSLQQ